MGSRWPELRCRLRAGARCSALTCHRGAASCRMRGCTLCVPVPAALKEAIPPGRVTGETTRRWPRRSRSIRTRCAPCTLLDVPCLRPCAQSDSHETSYTQTNDARPFCAASIQLETSLTFVDPSSPRMPSAPDATLGFRTADPCEARCPGKCGLPKSASCSVT